MPSPIDNIQHVIVLMLENRSFDHTLGFFKHTDPADPNSSLDGLSGTESNLDENDDEVVVSMDAKYCGDYRSDPGHHFPDVTYQLFEKNEVKSTAKPTMGGFVFNYGKQPGSSVEASHRIMKCFDAGRKLPALTTLVTEFASCDRWFSSVPGPTLPNRAFAHAATSLGHVDMNPVAYWNINTLYEQLNGQGVTSRVYSHDGNTLAFMFKGLFKKGGKYLGSFQDFLDDLNGKKLPKYCFIEPRFNDWYDESTHTYYIADDQHPDNNVAEGDLLIAQVYDALRKSKYWEKSLFVVTYDEHGGFFDHVRPPNDNVVPSGLEPAGSVFDFKRLGVRVPAVLVSPWIEKGKILHDRFEHSSLAASARVILAPNMPALTQRDAAANSFDIAVTRTTPRSDTPEKIDMKGVRHSDVDPNTHGAATLSDQQRNQVLAAYFMDLDRPAGSRIIGSQEMKLKGVEVLEDINTEQKGAEYIKAVKESL